MCYRLGALGRSVAGAVTVSATEGDPVTEKVAVVRRHSQSGPPERDDSRPYPSSKKYAPSLSLLFCSF